MRPRPGPAQARDAGSAAVAIAVIFPAIAVLFLALAQAVLLAAAHDVAVASAEDGLRVARAHGSTPARGRAAALAFARHEPVLAALRVTTAGTTTITVRVSGQAPSLLPGVHLTVAGTAAGAQERFTTDTRGFTNPGRSPGTEAGPRP